MAVSGFTPAANADQGGPAPAVCVGLRYEILFGEGIAVTCPAPGRAGTMYRANAYCATGTAEWHQYGMWVQPGFGPSAAACQGGLLASAQVVGYDVETR
ncbi:hypothetical protein GCM10029964_083120 [Kibdelosporangium lantanae]